MSTKFCQSEWLTLIKSSSIEWAVKDDFIWLISISRPLLSLLKFWIFSLNSSRSWFFVSRSVIDLVWSKSWFRRRAFKPMCNDCIDCIYSYNTSHFALPCNWRFSIWIISFFPLSIFSSDSKVSNLSRISEYCIIKNLTSVCNSRVIEFWPDSSSVDYEQSYSKGVSAQ